MTSENGSAPAMELGGAGGFVGGGSRRLTKLIAPQPLVQPAGAASQRGQRVTPGTARPIPHDALPRDHFVATLRREMRRADRSKAALSLVIYRLAQTAGPADVEALRGCLASSKRETDVLGDLGNGVLAVICTDTGIEGSDRFMQKIDTASGDLAYSVESATYPDHLFEGLTSSPAAAHSPSPLLMSERDLAHGEVYRLKRPLDLIGAALLLLLLSPLMVLAALAVKLSSRGPVIFRQTRLGKGGRPFDFYKFRSMRVDNDDRIHREYVASLIRGEPTTPSTDSDTAATAIFKIQSDPRVTWIGRIIRKTSIDELPQLYNVLRGDMSLVGPRPPLPYEAENYQSWHLRRVLDVRPGITGLWQVEGRGKLPFDKMVRMDLRYIRGCSLDLDLRILAKTVPVVLSCDGAS